MISATLCIVIITGLVSYQGFNDREFFERFKHSPYIEDRNSELYRMLTSGFLHGSWTHLIVNMYVLHEFGQIVEKYFVREYGLVPGIMLYLLFYLVAIVVADLPTYKKHKNDPSFASIGASGATSAILFLYIFFQPWSWLGLFFVIPVPAFLLGVGYLWYTTWAAKNSNDNIDHSAHFSGAVYGFVLGFVLFASRIPEFVNEILAGPTWPF